MSSRINGVTHGTGSLDRVDDQCLWTATFDGTTLTHELRADGSTDGGSWKSDSDGFVVTYGSLIIDCHR